MAAFLFWGETPAINNNKIATGAKKHPRNSEIVNQ